MNAPDLSGHIVRTLIYYGIFDHPLSADELFYLFPRNSLTKPEIERALEQCRSTGAIEASRGFFYLPDAGDLSAIRLEREKRARGRMRIARFMAGVIRRFPFVRGIFLSGDLSKGVATAGSDIDYVIVTEPGRLWICRTLLMLFKKGVLFNSRKYFCLNYYVDSLHLEVPDRNYYTATEIAHLKPLYGQALFLRYMNANAWITEYFPNFKIHGLTGTGGSEGGSLIRTTLELVFSGGWADRLERRLMRLMEKVWVKRYPGVDAETRSVIFRSNSHESRAYVGNFAARITALYNMKLEAYHEAGGRNLPPPPHLQ